MMGKCCIINEEKLVNGAKTLRHKRQRHSPMTGKELMFVEVNLHLINLKMTGGCSKTLHCRPSAG